MVRALKMRIFIEPHSEVLLGREASNHNHTAYRRSRKNCFNTSPARVSSMPPVTSGR